MDEAALNTDRELWRDSDGDCWSNSIFVTEGGGIGINVGGHVIVQPLAAWHALAARPTPTPADAAGRAREDLLPCPFCALPMSFSGGVFAHDDMTEASRRDCPLKGSVWASCHIPAWNTRAAALSPSDAEGWLEKAALIADETLRNNGPFSLLPQRIRALKPQQDSGSAGDI